MRLLPLLLFFITFAPSPVLGAPTEIKTTVIEFNPDKAGTAPLGKLEFVRGVEYQSRDKRFGGFSGLLIEGEQLISLTDKGQFFSATINHETLSLTGASFFPILSPEGRPVKKKKDSDAESLASDGQGGFYVTFERKHRVSRYPTLSSPALELPTPNGLSKLPKNHGLEASVRLQDGRLLILSEASTTGEENIASGWFLDNGTWKAFSYQKIDGFKPTGAAQTLSGEVLIIERYFTILEGVSIRIRRIKPAAIKAGQLLSGELLGEITAPFLADNFEGIATRTDKNGDTLIYVLSDDNFSALQKTLLFVFKLNRQK